MPESWKTFTVEELIKNKILEKPLDGNHGGTHPKGKDFISSGIPFVMASDIIRGQVNLKSCSFISKNQGDKLRKGFAIEGDVLLTHKASIGRTAIVPKIETDYIMLTPQVTYYRILDKKQLNNHYLKFYFNSPTFQNELNMRAGSGSTRAYIGITDQQKLSIKVPPIQEQKSIASILSALDDKIELNLQMNKTLEKMAMALYKHWFVDFGPFQDGEFVESELGEIPKGWEVKKLKDYIKNSQYGFTQSSSSEKIGPKFLRITDIQGGTVNWDDVPYCKTTEKEFEKYKIVKGDIFVARTGNSTGENVYSLKPQNAVFASYLIRFQFQELHQACYIAKIFRSKTFSDFINGAKVGSAQPGISASALGELQILIPPDSVLQSYFEIVNPFDFKRETVFEENQTLTQLRDTLLPKLISGEVRVKDVEKTLTEVL